MRTSTKHIIIVSLVTTNIDKDVAIGRRITLVQINKHIMEYIVHDSKNQIDSKL